MKPKPIVVAILTPVRLTLEITNIQVCTHGSDWSCRDAGFTSSPPLLVSGFASMVVMTLGTDYLIIRRFSPWVRNMHVRLTERPPVTP